MQEVLASIVYTFREANAAKPSYSNTNTQPNPYYISLQHLGFAPTNYYSNSS